jgi:ubiquitin-conjugating enzyme E2 variant
MPCVSDTRATLPAHYELTPGQFRLGVVSIVTAFALLGWMGVRVVLSIELLQWWVAPALVAGMAAADFGSGIVHWTADTWGRDDCPIIGQRLLVPFRVHHVNPDDFLRRRFVDTNGEVAVIAIPCLLALLSLPLATWWGGPVAVFGVGFCAAGSMTNQIHQWAHMPAPPAAIRVLQSARVLLGRVEHAAHHDRPYDCHYCITTGWCNRPLDAIDFFRRCERAITLVTGVVPRHDDRRYETRYAAALDQAGLARE